MRWLAIKYEEIGSATSPPATSGWRDVACSRGHSSIKHGESMALQAPGDDSAHLIYEFERRAYPVRNALLTIGRDASSHILIREPAVLRNHAELRAEEGKFVL